MAKWTEPDVILRNLIEVILLIYRPDRFARIYRKPESPSRWKNILFTKKNTLFSPPPPSPLSISTAILSVCLRDYNYTLLAVPSVDRDCELIIAWPIKSQSVRLPSKASQPAHQLWLPIGTSSHTISIHLLPPTPAVKRVGFNLVS